MIKVLHKAILDKELSTIDKLVFIYLLEEAFYWEINTCNVNNEYIASQIGIDKKDVRKSLSLLKNKKYIGIHFLPLPEIKNKVRCIEIIDLHFNWERKPIKRNGDNYVKEKSL